MFDATTAALLRSAPAMPGLDPNDIPALLTAHYANLAAARLRGVAGDDATLLDGWTLERVADTYELATSLASSGEARRPAAFVAGTAQQILFRRQLAVAPEARKFNIDRDRVDPSIAAAVLFLAAEQYADANEAASSIQTSVDGQSYEATILSECIVDLAKGRLPSILLRAARWRVRDRSTDIEERALAALLGALIEGIEILAVSILRQPITEASTGRFDTGRAAFEAVQELSTISGTDVLSEFGDGVVLAYSGPHHLASLLIAAADGLETASLMSTPPPEGANGESWNNWLAARAALTPYVWPNHRDAIKKGFYLTGISSVVVLPTGAGKTTVSSLKIAGALAGGKKVVFLAPTHALVEQLTNDLQSMFPADIMGSTVSSDFDLLMLDEASFNDIEVMTPERCLAMLSFAPEAFGEVGLLVFDECHLLSPESGHFRRALDAMLCVLGFHHVAPDADMLFLSAMVKNPDELAGWVESLTGRPCIPVDLPWKPSRQARGVIVYDDAELEKIKLAGKAAQIGENRRAGKNAKALRQAAKNELAAHPHAIWGLQHNWLSDDAVTCITTAVSDQPVLLAGTWYPNYGVRLTPNANVLATHLASLAANSGLKTIVFVNTKADAVNVAKAISESVGTKIEPTDAEQERWTALEEELGGLQHAVISGPAVAVPHNSAMLKLERNLCESMFQRSNGAAAIVATPTLAQGLNLPAQFAILAGDKRAAKDTKREALKAHEILNAAARAGRAGHLANGLVLLIPEPVISFKKPDEVSQETIEKLRSVLPEDDHCVTVSDPLEIVLDRLMGGDTGDLDVQYTLNRFAVLREVEGSVEEPTVLFDPNKSLGAYVASVRNKDAEFAAKVAKLKSSITAAMPGALDDATALLATQSGLSAQLLMDLRDHVKDKIGELPETVDGWLEWTLTWLDKDAVAREALFGDIAGRICTSLGKGAKGNLEDGDMLKLLPALRSWIMGQPLRQIEIDLGGTPDDPSSRPKQLCPRARELVGSILPRGLSFTMNLVAKVIKDLDPYEDQPTLGSEVVEALGTALRKGYDTPEKLYFALEHTEILSRVKVHKAFAKSEA